MEQLKGWIAPLFGWLTVGGISIAKINEYLTAISILLLIVWTSWKFFVSVEEWITKRKNKK